MTALNHNPVYGTYPKTAHAKVASGTGIANTDLDDSITGGTVLLTAPAGGCAVTRLGAAQIEPAITTACQLNDLPAQDRRLARSPAEERGACGLYLGGHHGAGGR
jgi:hypothetical protein